MTPTTASAPAAPRGLSPAVVAWLVAGAIASFAAFLAAIAYQPELSAGVDRGAHAASRSPVGFAGLAQLLRADGAQVRFNHMRDPGRTVDADALLVLTPGPSTTAVDVRRLAKGRRVLLILPKWMTRRDPRRLDRVASAGTLYPAQAAALAAAVLAPARGDGPVTLAWDGGAHPVLVAETAGEHDLGFTPARLRPIASLRTLSGQAAQPVLVDGAGRTLVAIGGHVVAYVAADPDLLDNHGVADLAGARVAVSLVEALADGGPVVFDMTLPGFAGQRSLLKLAFAPPFLPATACAALLVALLGLAARERFGPLRRAGRGYGFGKRALADSAASLLAVAGREPRLAGRYVELVRASALAATGVAADADRAVQDQALDRIGRDRAAGAWSEIAARSATVKTREQLMALAKQADAWRMEMTRGRG